MHKIGRERIIIEDRQRSGEGRSFRDKDLRASIETKGLLHPIVLAPVLPIGTGYRLVAGGRRLANIDWIAEDGGYFVCNRETILPGEVPAILTTDLSTLDLIKAEYEENARRLELPWQDATRALARIHDLEVTINPQATIIATAEKIAESTGKSVAHVREKLSEAKVVAEHLSDPAIKNARNANEAYSLIVKKEEAALQTLLAKQLNTLPATVKVYHGDCTKVLSEISDGVVDLILADPPYAIGVGDSGFRSRTVHHHNYSDTEADAKAVISAALSEGFRCAKNRANIFLFTDIALWSYIHDAASRAGWTPWRTPLIWAKSDSEGLAPWGRSGFRRTYEIIFWATKGQRGLLSSPTDILRFNRVSRSERDYGPEKPLDLLKLLISCSTMPRDTVLDPCCGSGNSILAAKELNRFAIGIDASIDAYNLTMAKLSGAPTDVKQPEVADL